MTSFSDYLERINRLTMDASYFASMGKHALTDADRCLVELAHLEFPEVQDPIKRSKLYGLKAVSTEIVSKAIEDAE